MFSIKANLTIEPSDVKAAIESAFDVAYRGQRGSAETQEEFLLRKLEEHVLAIYQNHVSQAAAAEASQRVQEEIIARAQIRQPIEAEPKAADLAQQ